MLSVKFSDAAAALAAANTAVTVAEAHGALCGALCASHDYSVDQWLEEVSDEIEMAGSDSALTAKTLLTTIFNETEQALRGQQMEFGPLLPEDTLPLAQRAEGLAQWCQGFLYGFGALAGTARTLSAEVDEVLRDLTQIARVTAGDSEPTEEDEEDYMEIVEYVRVGVQTIYDELRPTLQ